MAFPIIEEITTETHDAASDWALPLHTTVNSDELLILIVGSKNSSVMSTPAGWTERINTNLGGAVYSRLAIFTKQANGSEGGTTVSIPEANGYSSAAMVVRSSGWNGIEVSAVAKGNSNFPDSPILTPSWGAKDTLWIACYGYDGSSGHVSGSPANYTTRGYAQAADMTVGAATREYNVSSQDPNSFDMFGTSSELWTAATIAIEPAGDSTAPTPGGNLRTSNVTHTTLDLNWDKATDDISAQSDLVYYVYQASAGTDLSTVSAAETNGTLLNPGGWTNANTKAVSDLMVDTQYEFQVVVEDEAGNKAAYTQISETTTPISGTVTKDGVAVEGASIIYLKDGEPAFDTTPSYVETVKSDVNGDWQLTNYDGTAIGLIIYIYPETILSGTATSGASSSLTDTGLSMTTDEYADGKHMLKITGGTGQSQERLITSNDADTFTVNLPWETVPDGTSTYEVIKLSSDKSEVVAQLRNP